MQTPSSISYKRHRFPPEIIAHAVWLYVRFNLSLREVEEMLLERGVDVSYETIRRWTAKFGPQIARNLRRRQVRPGNVWHLDEVVVKIAGKSFWLWRAAKRLLVRLMKRTGLVPKRIVTDKLRSYGAAKREVAPGLDHWSHKGLNNRAENSHLPFRKRERAMHGYRSPGALQRFVSIHSVIRNSFSVPARRRKALTIRYHRMEAIDAWRSATGIA